MDQQPYSDRAVTARMAATMPAPIRFGDSVVIQAPRVQGLYLEDLLGKLGLHIRFKGSIGFIRPAGFEKFRVQAPGIAAL